MDNRNTKLNFDNVVVGDITNDLRQRKDWDLIEISDVQNTNDPIKSYVEATSVMTNAKIKIPKREVFFSPLVNRIETVDQWVARVVENGGSVTNQTIKRVSSFYRGLDRYGLSNKILRLNLFSGDQLEAAVVPLIDYGSVGNDIPVNFVQDDYSESTGLKPNGTTKHLNTQLLCSQCMGSCVWLRDDDATSANSKWLGAQDGSNFFGMGRQSSTRTEVVIGSIASRIIFTEAVAPKGFQHLQKSSDSLRVYYRNGIEKARNTVSSTEDIPVNRKIFIFAGNDSALGNPVFRNSTAQLGYALDNGTFTPDDALNYYNLWAEFQDSRP
jgi:hypothetical protein